LNAKPKTTLPNGGKINSNPAHLCSLEAAAAEWSIWTAHFSDAQTLHASRRRCCAL